MRIAVLDDEPLELNRMHETLKSVLLFDGERPHLHLFQDSLSLLKELKRETFDVLILDWQVPEMSGLQVLHWTQEHLSPAPAVILLTGRSAEQDVVRALMAGAADYICKPFRPAELIARLHNVLRRHRPTAATTSTKFLTFGDIVFDTHEERVSKANRAITLTPREYQLALLLFTNQDRPLSRQYLYEHLWSREEEFVSRSLDTHIYRLRSKLHLTAEHGWTLSTIYGFGYRLMPVTPEEGQT
jgi:DNA-binding response OmpR family regulator